MNEIINTIISLHKRGFIKDALYKIEDYEKENNLDPFLYNLKGLTYFLLNDYNNALNCYGSALKNFDNSINSNEDLKISIINNIGLVKIKLAKFNDAIKDFEKTIKIKTNFAEGYNNLGIVYKNLGKKYESVKNFVEANNSNENYKPAKENLINALTYVDNIKSENNKIVLANNEIKNLSFIFKTSKNIDDKNIKNTFEQSNKIINKYFEKINYNSTQTFRRNNVNLNCERHMKIFNENNIIPEYCFECYKVLIEPKNVVDLIKLHILFDAFKFRNNNLRKCMIEMRKNLSGKYKGFIYCKSIEEAKQIENEISKNIKSNIDKNIKYQIKRGCSEYVESYPQFKNLEKNEMKYDNKWKEKEIKSDKKYPYLKTNISDRQTISGNSLKDILIIRNWIYFAHLTGDMSYKNISEEIYISKYIESNVYALNN